VPVPVGDPVENRHIDEGKTMTESAEEGRVFVQFGKLPNQELHLETAEKLLSALFESDRKRFGKYLQIALGIDL
jgi:hypothetical protein